MGGGYDTLYLYSLDMVEGCVRFPPAAGLAHMGKVFWGTLQKGGSGCKRHSADALSREIRAI